VSRKSGRDGFDPSDIGTEGIGSASHVAGSRGAGSPGKAGIKVDDNLKVLMQELGNAINESLSESDRIAEAIGEIREAGFDVFMVLEATIGFNRRSENEEEEEGAEAPENVFESAGTIKFSNQDQRFLKAMKITVEE
jgi:hypothetical protein